MFTNIPILTLSPLHFLDLILFTSSPLLSPILYPSFISYLTPLLYPLPILLSPTHFLSHAYPSLTHLLHPSIRFLLFLSFLSILVSCPLLLSHLSYLHLLSHPSYLRPVSHPSSPHPLFYPTCPCPLTHPSSPPARAARKSKSVGASSRHATPSSFLSLSPPCQPSQPASQPAPPRPALSLSLSVPVYSRDAAPFQR